MIFICSIASGYAQTADELLSKAKKLDRQGKYIDAIKIYKQVLSNYKQEYGEEAKELISIYNILGNVHSVSKLEKSQDAFNYYQQGLNLAEIHFGKESNEVAKFLVAISTPYRMMNQFGVAQDVQKQALAIFTKNKNYEGEADVLNALGNNELRKLEQGKGDFELAIGYYKKAIRIVEQYTPNEKWFLSNLNANIGVAFMEARLFAQAAGYMRHKFEFNKQQFGRHHPKVARAGIMLSFIYFNLEEYELALDVAQECLVAATTDYTSTEHPVDFVAVLDSNTFVIPTIVPGVLGNYIKIYWEQYLKTGDLELLKKSANVVAAVTKFVATTQQSFWGSPQQLKMRNRALYPCLEYGIVVYHELYKETGELEYIEKAFEIAEQNKAILLLSTLQAEKAAKYGGLPNDLAQKEKEMHQRIGKLEQAIRLARIKKEADTLVMRIKG
ncbi:MAG: tetratricopeptide repeat protein [Aureispira sp.]|nr:tetratricopeptide repeat protein [Aureispira sp.]